LSDKTFVTIVEASAPRGLDIDAVVLQARRYKELGAIAVNVPDYPRSGARTSALTLAVLLEQRAGVETLLHYSCRDRNLIGMQSDLVGAHALGLRNVLLTTGQPAPQATYADATSVFDVDAIGLTNMVVRLNQGLDIGGRAIGAPAQFHVGVGFNLFPPDPDAEWRRLHHKIAAGAEFIVTTPVFDLPAFDAILGRLQEPGVPIIAGLAALESVRQVEFLASEVTGVRVPNAMLARLRAATDETQEALAVTLELVAALRSRVQGLQITVLHGSTATAERLLSALTVLEERPNVGQEPHHV
jgi:homocysteine S-methyltransferase